MKKRIRHYFEKSDARLARRAKPKLIHSYCDKCGISLYFKGMNVFQIQKEFNDLQRDKRYKSYYGIKNGEYTYVMYMRKKNNVYYINPFTGKIIYKRDCDVALRDKLIKSIIQ